MKHPVPTACSLSCDKCRSSFLFNGHNVFCSVQDARARASACGWTHAGDKDFCPRCREDITAREPSHYQHRQAQD